MKFFIALFCLSFLGMLASLEVVPTIRLLGFLPFLLFSLTRLSLPAALLCSATAGLTLDLYTFGSPLGFFALNYSLTSLILFRYKKFFSEEKLFPFALYGVAFSFTSTLIHFFLYAIIDVHLKLSFLTLVTDLICMPLLDGVYTIIWVLLPLLLYKHMKPKLGPLLHELSRITR